MKTPLIIILGPTGVGKTDAALALGEQTAIEIINGDMGQLYEPLTIGTAKPNWRHEPIPHHLFDSINEPRRYSAAEYRRAVLSCGEAIARRGALPVIVGGSGFYIKSLFFPLQETQQTEEASAHYSWAQLAQVDAQRAAEIHPHDDYRINRAMALWQQGVLPSSCKPLFQPSDFAVHVVYLTRSREELYARIDARVEIMLEQGWIEEVQQLSDEWRAFVREKKIIGYPEIIEYLHDEAYTREQLIATIARKTRAYAKRQETFWRSFCRSLKDKNEVTLHELNLTLCDVGLYLNQLTKKLITRE
jgi:tRNA dimethylallyltransferase